MELGAALEAVALLMIGRVRRGLSGLGVSGAAGGADAPGGARAPGGAGKFAMPARERARVPFACSLCISHVPGVIPVTDVTYPAAQRRVFVDDFGSVEACGYWGPQNFPLSVNLPP